MEMYQGKGMLKTLSWTESGRSVLKLNIRHLWLLGVWPLGHSQVFKVYTSFTFAMGVWSVVECLLAVYFTWGHLEETTLVLIFTSTCSCAIIKLVFFLRDERSYSLMVREVASVMAAQSEACRDPALAAILRDSRSRTFRLSLGMLLFMFSQCFIWFPIPIVANAGERRLPFSQHGWDNNCHFYELSYTLQCLSGLYMSQISFGLDCLFASIMILVAAQLKILSGRVLKLNQEVIPPERNDSVLLRNQLAGDKYCDKFYEGLCFCIDSHQRILSGGVQTEECLRVAILDVWRVALFCWNWFVTLLQDTMSPVAMAQFASSVVIACMALFQATYTLHSALYHIHEQLLSVDSKNVLSAIFLWSPSPWHSPPDVQLGTIPRSFANGEGESVSVAAYSCSWVEGSAAGRLYPINRAAFLSLLNASYSYYALLGQMNKRSMKDLASHN
uniref:Odorant receptor n=1 Tax=Locusta migratoria TaxID=7004 RepID=A0A0M3SBM8_LOCMI|nr:odorant receptor 70 [Locusta migratoria]